ncbi:hypothetical protein MKW92_008070, partial [Papaver armeniacum]
MVCVGGYEFNFGGTGIYCSFAGVCKYDVEHRMSWCCTWESQLWPVDELRSGRVMRNWLRRNVALQHWS